MEMTMMEDKKEEKMSMQKTQFYGETMENKMVNPRDIFMNFMDQKKEVLMCELDLAKIKFYDTQTDPASGYSYIAEKKTDVEVLKGKIDILNDMMANFKNIMPQ